MTPTKARIVAAHWANIAAMEHASVAAFARSSLQLLAHGAPPELMTQTAEAMADEVRHAQLAYGLAAAYGAQSVGPGPLNIDAAAAPMTLVELIESTIVETCIGETVAAVEAAQMCAHGLDPRIRETAAIIARDELSHAALGWRILEWLIDRSKPAERAQALRCFEDNIASRLRTRQAMCATTNELTGYGILPDDLLTEVHTQTLLEVVLPLARALLAEGVS